MLSLFVLGMCDLLFFIGTAIACDSIPSLLVALVAYLLELIVITLRIMRYYFFIQQKLHYRQSNQSLPVPSSDLQAMLAATSYSTLVACVVLFGAKATGLIIVAWIMGVISNVLYAFITDDRPALRAYIATFIIRQQRGGDPSANRVSWSASAIPPTVAIAIADDAWSDISLDESDSDATDDIFSNMPATRREALVNAVPTPL